jgi:hypothetical protein
VNLLLPLYVGLDANEKAANEWSGAFWWQISANFGGFRLYSAHMAMGHIVYRLGLIWDS